MSFGYSWVIFEFERKLFNSTLIFLDLVVFFLKSITISTKLKVKLSPLILKSSLQIRNFSLDVESLVRFKRIFDLVNLFVLASLESLEFGFPRIDFRNSLVKSRFDIRVILVHHLDLFQGFMVFTLKISINFRRGSSFFVLLDLQGLLLTEVSPFVTFFFEAIWIKCSFSEFLDLDFVAVSIKIFFLHFLEPK